MKRNEKLTGMLDHFERNLDRKLTKNELEFIWWLVSQQELKNRKNKRKND